MGRVSELRIKPSTSLDTHSSLANPIKLPLQNEYHLFFYVRNAWKQTHDLRVIFLLDFQQIAMSVPTGQSSYFDFVAMNSQEDRR